MRTIQRAEGDQQESPGTVKALASVFEADVDRLSEQSEPIYNYTKVQPGYTLMIVTLVVVQLSTRWFTQGRCQPGVYAALMVVCAVISSVFCTLTTRVESGYLKWDFGIGLIRIKFLHLAHHLQSAS